MQRYNPTKGLSSFFAIKHVKQHIINVKGGYCNSTPFRICNPIIQTAEPVKSSD